MTEAEGRQNFCRIARTYIGTPYHDRAMVKGHGADCVTFPIMAGVEAGLIAPFTPKAYSPQWFLHHSEELWIEGLLRFAKEVIEPQPGDIALFKVGRCFAHGAIVQAWPLIIHASKPDGIVSEADASKGELGDRKKHPVRFFSLWA